MGDDCKSFCNHGCTAICNAVTYFVYRAFSLNSMNFFEVMFLQAVISVSVDMLPLPGGMGISEGLFMVIFKKVFGEALLIPGLILSRGLGYYSELFFHNDENGL